jgi:hypothetical protein
MPRTDSHAAPRLLLRRQVLPWLVLALAPACLPARADEGGSSDEAALLERRVKAVFLYKFVDYVTWPVGTFALPDAPLVIGVLGDDHLARELGEVLAGRPGGGRPLGVRRFHDGEPMGGMHVLFVAREQAARLAPLARAAAAQPLLLVSEWEGALDQGSAINFTLVDGRVKFDIALDAAESRGLKLSSRLLTVARKVRPASAPASPPAVTPASAPAPQAPAA